MSQELKKPCLDNSDCVVMEVVIAVSVRDWLQTYFPEGAWWSGWMFLQTETQWLLRPLLSSEIRLTG